MTLKDLLFQKFHVIHAHSTFPSGYWGLIFSRLFRIPIVVSLDAAEASAIPDLNFGDLMNPRRERINRWVIKRADKIIVLTNFLLNEVKRNLNIDREMSVIPRGVDLIKFDYKGRQIEGPYRFLSVGYLHPVKDNETLLKAFSIISKKIDCRLIHIGEDYSDGKIQRMVSELGLEGKVEFKGFVPNDSLPMYYAQSDILLHTSRFESQAVVVNEALASGLLVCGTNFGLLADLSGKCCLTVEPGDYEGLASRVLDLLTKPALMNQLLQAGHAWSKEHDLSWTVSKHVEIYEDLLSKSAR
jgi:glycosyltransferase involved in cell wall biosynthesis